MTVTGFALLAFAFFLPAFVCMALLVKLTHSALAPMREGDPRVVWLSAAVPGLVATVICGLAGLWPMAVDCALSAFALGILGKRHVPAPPFQV